MKMLTAILFLSASSAALAQSQEKKNAIENLASLIVAEKWCSDYIIKRETIASIAIATKIDLSNKSEKGLLEEKRAEFEKVMGEAGANAYCTYAYKVFGPGGDIPGLMMKR